MSADSDKPEDPAPLESLEGAEEEPSGGALAPTPELEEALREAAEAVESKDGAKKLPTRGMKVPEGELELPSDLREQNASLRAELEELRAAHDELEQRYLRLNADYDNHRRRTLKERENAHRYGHENVVKDLLSTVDNLERAVDHARSSGDADFESMLQGVELVQRELLGGLAKHGVAVIEADGEPFDPEVHEAMAQHEDDSVPANTVVQVFQRGYRLRDRLLRPARVVVSRRPEPPKEQTEGVEGEDAED